MSRRRKTLAPRVAHRRSPERTRPVRTHDDRSLALLRAVVHELDDDGAWEAAAFARRLHADLASGQPSRVAALLGRLRWSLPASFELVMEP
jgi:hypothetical protein